MIASRFSFSYSVSKNCSPRPKAVSVFHRIALVPALVLVPHTIPVTMINKHWYWFSLFISLQFFLRILHETVAIRCCLLLLFSSFVKCKLQISCPSAVSKFCFWFPGMKSAANSRLCSSDLREALTKTAATKYSLKSCERLKRVRQWGRCEARRWVDGPSPCSARFRPRLNAAIYTQTHRCFSDSTLVLTLIQMSFSLISTVSCWIFPLRCQVTSFALLRWWMAANLEQEQLPELVAADPG